MRWKNVVIPLLAVLLVGLLVVPASAADEPAGGGILEAISDPNSRAVLTSAGAGAR